VTAACQQLYLLTGAFDTLLQLVPQCSHIVAKEICLIFSFLTAKDETIAVEQLLKTGLLQVSSIFIRMCTHTSLILAYDDVGWCVHAHS
jgi:hypothetical protein